IERIEGVCRGLIVPKDRKSRSPPGIVDGIEMIGCPPTCDRVACRKAEVRRGRTRCARHVRYAVDDQPGAADRLVRTQVTALAELLVGYGPSAFLCRMGCGKELHAFP